MRLRMRLAGRLTELHMTLDQLDRPALVRYHTVQNRMPDATHQRHFEPAAEGFNYRLVVPSHRVPVSPGFLTAPCSGTRPHARCAKRSTIWHKSSPQARGPA